MLSPLNATKVEMDQTYKSSWMLAGSFAVNDLGCRGRDENIYAHKWRWKQVRRDSNRHSKRKHDSEMISFSHLTVYHLKISILAIFLSWVYNLFLLTTSRNAIPKCRSILNS